MKMKSVRKVQFALIATALIISLPALAGKETGGGDICENNFRTVSLDVKSWILRGGANELLLPAGVQLDDYVKSMTEQIDSASIKCVGPNDVGYPVEVSGTPKTCKFVRDEFGSTIFCDIQKFDELTEDDRYVLVHHEYAGLAGVEKPKGGVSNYEVSNQISAFLEATVSKKLAVKSRASILGTIDGNYKLVPGESTGRCNPTVYVKTNSKQMLSDIGSSNEVTYPFGQLCRDAKTGAPTGKMYNCDDQMDVNVLSSDSRSFNQMIATARQINGAIELRTTSTFSVYIFPNRLGYERLYTESETYDVHHDKTIVFDCAYERIP
jgi:hypothetical protein